MEGARVGPGEGEGTRPWREGAVLQRAKGLQIGACVYVIFAHATRMLCQLELANCAFRSCRS